MTTTTGLPEPRFLIGHKFFYGTIKSENQPYPCPDCLGSHKWKIITPAGDEFETTCQRCYNGDLSRTVWVPLAKPLTVGSIKIDTAGDRGWSRSLVQYMAEETGVGSGSVYDQADCGATEEEALAVAQVKADEQNTKEQERNRVALQRRESLSYLRIRDAAIQKGEWAQSSLDDFRGQLRNVLEREGLDIPYAVRDALEDIR